MSDVESEEGEGHSRKSTSEERGWEEECHCRQMGVGMQAWEACPGHRRWAGQKGALTTESQV